MTLGAVQVAIVIKRLKRQARVLVDVGQPGIRHVADVALLHGVEVPVVLAGCRVAIVAGRAGAQYLRVVDSGNRCPGRGGVAVFANIGRRYVRRVLAGCIRAVVTAETVVGDVDVIEVGRDPRDCRMAVIAVVAAGDMRGMLAGCGVAIVAGHAGSEHVGVVHHVSRRPGHVVVAVLADVRRGDVRRVLAGCISAVVAA